MIFRDITDTKFKGIEISSYHEFDHEKVYYYEDDNTGIKSLVAIHDSSKGPAIGGCRFKEYDSFEQGLNDVLRLSRGMTHKNNVAQIPFGGGKAILGAFGDARRGSGHPLGLRVRCNETVIAKFGLVTAKVRSRNSPS